MANFIWTKGETKPLTGDPSAIALPVWQGGETVMLHDLLNQPSPASNESSKLMYGGNGKLFIRLSSELNPVGTLLRY
jgi:hypothetical protein